MTTERQAKLLRKLCKTMGRDNDFGPAPLLCAKVQWNEKQVRRAMQTIWEPTCGENYSQSIEYAKNAVSMKARKRDNRVLSTAMSQTRGMIHKKVMQKLIENSNGPKEGI